MRLCEAAPRCALVAPAALALALAHGPSAPAMICGRGVSVVSMSVAVLMNRARLLDARDEVLYERHRCYFRRHLQAQP
jgi:hypothetical protein